MSNQLDSTENENPKFKRKVGKILFSLGVGGIVSFVISTFWFENSTRLISNFSNSMSFQIPLSPNFILIISIICLITSPLMLLKNERNGTILYSYIVLLIITGIFMLASHFVEQLTLAASILVWCSMTLFIWISFDIVNLIYDWLLIKENEEGSLNSAKLTLLWGILVFIMGLILSNR